MKSRLRAISVSAIYFASLFMFRFGVLLDAGRARGAAQPTAENLREALASLSTVQEVSTAAPQRVTNVAVQATATTRAREDRLQIDPEIARSLATTGCAIHNHSNSPAAYAASLGLPPGPYTRVFGTSSGSRYLSIVGDDCDHIAIPNAPSVRMVSTHRMANGFVYYALFNARGNVLAMLQEPVLDHYIPIDVDHGRTPKIETIYVDLKAETDSWNKALLRLLQRQTEQEQQAPQKKNGQPL